MSHLYLKSAIWDFVLVLCTSCSLCYAVLNGFYVDPSLQYGPVPALICSVVLVALFAAASNGRVARIAGPLVALALIASWVASASLTPEGAFLVDDESNYLIFAMATTLSAVGCFLMSRTRTGSALLFIVGVFIVVLIQFFYARNEVLGAIAFVASSLALVIFKNYQTALKASTSVRKVSFAPGFAVALAATALAVGVGAGIWYGIIAPLNPDAVEVKLVTEHRALETLRVKGIADVYQEPNLDMTSDVTNDGERTTDDIKEGENGRQVAANGTGDEHNEDDGSDDAQGTGFLGVNLDVPDNMFDFLSYLQQHLLMVVAIAVLFVAAIVGFFLGRRHLRKRRLARVMKLPEADQVAVLYPFFVKKLERVGISKAPGQTLREYAAANASTMAAFDAEAGVAYTALTEDYVAVAYGRVEPAEGASERLRAYYNGFWKAARRSLGNFKYFFKSFRL